MSMIIDGTNGLTFNNATTQASAGCVLQVVNVAYNTFASTTSSTYSDTGLTVTITPKFATSKILVETFVSLLKNATNAQGKLQVVRNSTSIIEFEKGAPYTGTTMALDVGAVGTTYLDSPATTSATTYKIQFAAQSGYIGINDNNGYSTITVMEIAG